MSETWPPRDGRAFLQSEGFGEMLLRLSRGLARRNPDLDFSDACAQVFAWVDGKLEADEGFLASGRFPTPAAFAAYMRRALFNAALMARRQRARHRRVEPLPDDFALPLASADPQGRVIALEVLESLDEPHGTVLQMLFVEEVSIEEIAAFLGCDEDEAERAVERAIDELKRR